MTTQHLALMTTQGIAGFDFEAITPRHPRQPTLHAPRKQAVDVLAECFSNRDALQFYEAFTMNNYDTTAADGFSNSTYLDACMSFLSPESSKAPFTFMGSESLLDLWNGPSTATEDNSLQIGPTSTTEKLSMIEGTECFTPQAPHTESNSVPTFWTQGHDVKSSQVHLPVRQGTATSLSIRAPSPLPKRRRLRKQHEPPSADEVQRKRETFLARNRVAANKCRSRKRSQTADLMARVQEAQEMRIKLEIEYENILDEVVLLRVEAVRRASASMHSTMQTGCSPRNMQSEDVEHYWIQDEFMLCG